MRLNFILGEKRKVWLEISSNDGSAFTIRNATFELQKYGETTAKGDCDVNEHIVIATIQPAERGEYDLIFSFEIAGEIIKEKAVVSVE